jgi:hypothetical protein
VVKVQATSEEKYGMGFIPNLLMKPYRLCACKYQRYPIAVGSEFTQPLKGLSTIRRVAPYTSKPMF